MTEQQAEYKTPIPAIVLELARRVNLTAWQWKEYDDRVVIIFNTGQKMVFMKDPVPDPTSGQPALPDPVKKKTIHKSKKKA